MKILFADDDADTRTTFNLGLHTIGGHEVHLAQHGTEAVQTFNNHDFDVVIMDLEMPLMDGWEAISLIRQTERGAHIPIVVLTAYYTPNHIRSIEKEKINIVLSKPIPPQLLMEIVEAMVWASQHPQPAKQ
jgi:CheY-like chemotaxis protein